MSEQQELDIQELEGQIKGAKDYVARAERLERLKKNADFIELIEEGFFKTHAVRQVMLKAHPAYMDNKKMQDMFDSQIMAVGGFQQFLLSIEQEGRRAKEELIQAEGTLAEILDEQNEGGADA